MAARRAADEMILVGDVGGTRTRLALAVKEGGRWCFERLEEQATSSDVPAAVGRYLAGGAGRPSAAAFCGAGPLLANGSIRLTNNDVQLQPASLARAAGVVRAILVNDFQAVAHAIPALDAGSLVPAGGGEPVADAPRVVLGPGTGLGVAILARAGGGWGAIAGEGGHVDLAPVDDEELAAWQRLRSGQRRVSAETVLSGSGLERLYAALAGDGARSAGEIDTAARRGEPTAVRTITLFTRWLGRVAGNLALTAGASGGVYLAGGILPRWGGLFDAKEFRRGFEDKPPLGHWLRGIPAWVVTHPQPGLLGLAELAAATPTAR